MKNRFILIGKVDFIAPNGEKSAEFLQVLTTAETVEELMEISKNHNGPMIWIDSQAENQHAITVLNIAKSSLDGYME